MVAVAISHGTRVSDAIDIEGNAQNTVAMSTSGAQTAAPLDEGVYDVWCDDANVFIKVAPTANDVTTSTGYRIAQSATVPVLVRAGSKLGGILASGTGTLRYHRVG